MSIYNLDHLFKPKSLALFYNRAQSLLGETLFKNLIFGKYNHPIFLISKEEEVL